MTPTVVKAADAAQFLSIVPRMLGYHPTRSLVVIPFHGGRWRKGARPVAGVRRGLQLSAEAEPGATGGSPRLARSSASIFA